MNAAIPPTRTPSSDLAHETDLAARGHAALARLARSDRQLLLFVAHAWGGGIRQHMNELAALIAAQCDVLLLEPAGRDTVRLSWLKPGEDLAAYFALPADMQALVATLRADTVAFNAEHAGR